MKLSLSAKGLCQTRNTFFLCRLWIRSWWAYLSNWPRGLLRRLPFLLHSQQQQLQVTISSLFSSSAIIINNSNNRKSTVPSFAVPLDFFASLVLPSELSLLHHHVHGFSLMPHLPSCQFRSLHTRWPSTHDFWHSHDPLSLSFIDSWLPTDIPHALCLR